MGLFSFTKGDDGYNFRINEKVVLKNPFSSKRDIKGYYDGYGRINGEDVYFNFALWNRKVILENKDLFLTDDIKNRLYIKMFFDEKKSNSFFRKIENDAVVDEIRLLGIKLYYSEKKITKYPLRFCNIDSKLKYSKLQDAIDDPTQGTGVYHSEMGYKCVCENCGCEFWSDWGEDKCLECSIFDEDDCNE